MLHNIQFSCFSGKHHLATWLDDSHAIHQSVGRCVHSSTMYVTITDELRHCFTQNSHVMSAAFLLCSMHLTVLCTTAVVNALRRSMEMTAGSTASVQTKHEIFISNHPKIYHINTHTRHSTIQRPFCRYAGISCCQLTAIMLLVTVHVLTLITKTSFSGLGYTVKVCTSGFRCMLFG